MKKDAGNILARVKREVPAKWIVVTPAKAAEWLKSMARNRNIRKKKLTAMCDDRVRGAWRITHQGIAFNDADELVDGQHRLRMVVETGLETVFLVVSGLPVESLRHIDGIMPRSLRDAMYIGGIGKYAKEFLSALSGMYTFPAQQNNRLSVEQAVEAEKVHGAAVRFACEALPAGYGLTKAPRTLIARAYYYEDRDRLAEFGSIVSTGATDGKYEEDRAAFTYHNVLMKMSLAKSYGLGAECARYRKGQAALKAFIERDPITRLYGRKDDLYPLPENGCTEAT